MRALLSAAVIAALFFALAARAASGGDPEAGKRIFQTVCHRCHAALPYTVRIGVANLPNFLANPRVYKPSTAMNFPGLRSKKDIEDVIAYITGNH
jgi:cytochrome c2